MKNIFLIICLVFISQMSFGQYGGTIRAVNSSGIADYVYRVGSALRVSDSLAQLKLDSLKAHLPIVNGKLSIDSISIKSMPSFSVSTTVNASDSVKFRKVVSIDNFPATQPVSFSGHDSTTDSRIGVKLIQNPTITNTSFGISGTLPAFSSTPTVNIGTTGTIPVSIAGTVSTSGGLTDAQLRATAVPVSLSSVPSHAVTNAGTFATQVTSLPSIPSGSNAIGSITNTSFGISGTLPAFAATPTFNLGTGGYLVSAADSTKYRIGIKVLELPLLPSFASTPTVNVGTGGYSVSASDSTKYRITHKISESALPVGAATESTLSSLNTKIPSNLTVNSNRLAIYSPDSIKVYTTGGFGGGGGGGGDASSANQVISNNLLQGIKTADSNVSTIVSQVGEGEHGGIVSYGYDYTEGDIFPFSAKLDNNLADNERGIPIALWNNTDGEYNFMQVDGNYNVLTNDRTANTLLQGIKTLDSNIYNKLNDSIRVFATNGFGSGGGGGGGGTEYTEGATTSPAVGTAMLARYKAAPVTLTSDGLYTPVLDVNGNQKIRNSSTKVSYTFTAGGGTNQTLVLDTKGYSTVTIQTVSASWAGSVLTYQGTVDGTNWITIPGTTYSPIYNTNGNTQSQTIAVGSSSIFTVPTFGCEQIRLINLAAITAGSVAVTMSANTMPHKAVYLEASQSSLNVNAIGVAPGSILKAEDAVAANGDAGVAMLTVRSDGLPTNASPLTSATGDYGALVMDNHSTLIVKDQRLHKRTYSTTFNVVPAASATDIVEFKGSATFITRITRITVWGNMAAGAITNLTMVKHSTANSGGTSTTATLVAAESNDGSANAVINIYTANPTLGTVAGNYKTIPVPMVTTGLDPTGPVPVYDILFEGSKQPTLRSATEAFAFNLGGATLTLARLFFNFEFTEE